ncbi:MAG: glycoside hydrolase family 5 protein [Cyclobacteriaceae bacterium]|nr:glycoside hydrolase family 5 protein [Cyclobacteriaceae bacterium]
MCQPAKKETRSHEDEAIRFPLERGVNVSHWLSQSKARGEDRKNFFTKADMDFIAEIGYDHIRLPIDEEQMWDEAGNKDAEAFALLHDAIGWANDNELKVIVDLHILRSHHFNSTEKPLWTDPGARERFYQCWRDLSSELAKHPNELVAYELMNEPVADKAEDWNRLIAKATEAIRATEPQRFVVIGSNRWQSADTFDELEVPKNDPYIILSFHFYEPFLLTHHQAGWTDIGDYHGPVKYPGLLVEEAQLEAIADTILREKIESRNGLYDKTRLEAMMQKPIQKAKELNLQLYCGEWGCMPTVPRESLLAWYDDMRSILEKHDIGWTNWDYKGGFGIIDRNRDNQSIEDLIEVLMK